MTNDIFIGDAPNDKTGTPARQAGQIINQNFAYLLGKIVNSNKIITRGTSSLVDQKLTLYVGWVWEINGQQFFNPIDVEINFPFSATGKQRLDRVVFNTSNTFTRVAGAESVSNPIAEPVPNDTIDFGISLVTDSTVGGIIPPEDISAKQDISNQISVSLPATVLDSWHGKTVKFTNTGLLTIPSSFTNAGMTFEGITKIGVTLTWAITSPKTFEFGTPDAVAEKQIFTFMQNDGQDSIMILGI